MRKMIVFILVAVLILTVTGCAGTDNSTDIITTAPTSTAGESNTVTIEDNTGDPIEINSNVSIDDFMEEKSFGEYLNLDAYAEEMGYEAIVIQDVANGLYCETSNGIFLIQFMSGDICRFYAPTDQEGVFQSFQITHTVRSAEQSGDAVQNIKINDTILSFGYRVVDAIKIFLAWIVDTDDIYEDPFDGIPRSAGITTNIQIGPDPDAVRLSTADVTDIESRN